MLERNLEFLKRLAKGIESVFGERCEVVIHDFSDITQSLVHMEGNVTNRTIGAPSPIWLTDWSMNSETRFLIKSDTKAPPTKGGY